MENDHEQPSSSDDDEEIEEIIVLSDEDELLSKSSSPASMMMMPCSSRAEVRRGQIRPRTYTDPDDVPGSSDGASCTTDGEYGDAEDDVPSDQQRGQVKLTIKSEDNEDVATAKLILKRQDAIDDFLTFVEALLRSMQSEQVKKSLMNEISDILINAKTEEIERYRRPRLH